jgi:hypothetical protein
LDGDVVRGDRHAKLTGRGGDAIDQANRAVEARCSKHTGERSRAYRLISFAHA